MNTGRSPFVDYWYTFSPFARTRVDPDVFACDRYGAARVNGALPRAALCDASAWWIARYTTLALGDARDATHYGPDIGYWSGASLDAYSADKRVERASTLGEVFALLDELADAWDPSLRHARRDD